MDPDNITGEQPHSDPFTGELLEPVPAEVLACNFWLLAASPQSSEAPDAWFQTDGHSLPVVGALKQQMAMRKSPLPFNLHQECQVSPAQPEPQPTSRISPDSTPIPAAEAASLPPTGNLKLIGHYLLLPSFDWGVSDWHLDISRPFVKKYQPTVGYSPEEAAHARRVTVIAESSNVSNELLARLRSAGCMVDVIGGDGTNIATILAMI